MKEQALFCDGTASYVNPPQPAENETITLRFRTAKDDVDRVRLMTGVGGYDMKKESTRGEFDYYTINWRLNEELSGIALKSRMVTSFVITTSAAHQKKLLHFMNLSLYQDFLRRIGQKGR